MHFEKQREALIDRELDSRRRLQKTELSMNSLKNAF